MSNPWSITPADVAPADWADAAALDAGVAQARLDAAQVQVETYAPAFVTEGKTLPADLPPGWRLAVIYQARDIHNSAKLSGDYALTDVHAVRVVPLSAMVRSLVRPRSIVGPVG